jgi:hypothetical protein
MPKVAKGMGSPMVPNKKQLNTNNTKMGLVFSSANNVFEKIKDHITPTNKRKPTMPVSNIKSAPKQAGLTPV